MKTHKHYQIAYSAHRNTSFSPDKRAESECSFFDESIERIRSAIAQGICDNTALEKFERLFVASMNAKSRCASAAITGPAKFPVDRNNKAMETERKRCDEMLAFLKKATTPKQESGIILSNDSDCLEKLQAELDARTSAHEKMKAANKTAKGTYAPFQLTNNLASIKRIQGRIESLSKLKAQENTEIMVGTTKVVRNTEEVRLQLFFEGRPASDIVTLLKSNAFKWSPTRGCWQRQLTNNAIYAFKQTIKPALEQAT